MPKQKVFVVGKHTSMPKDLNEYKLCQLGSEPELDELVRGYLTLNITRLARAYDEMQKRSQNWSPLEYMFNTSGLDKLVETIGFPTKIMIPQTLMPHDHYRPNNEDAEIMFRLQSTINKYSMFATAEYATLTNILPTYARREKLALASLKRLKYHYRKDVSDNNKFSMTTAPANNATQRIHNPTPANTSPIHKTANDIHQCRCEFARIFKLPLTRFACSGKTAVRIAQNTSAERYIESYATYGGVCYFPGMQGAIMYISNACADDVLYATSGNVPPKLSMSTKVALGSVLDTNSVELCGLVKAEGPKIIQQEDGQPTNYAVKDFCQHKCVHEDLPAYSRFGCIIDLETA